MFQKPFILFITGISTAGKSTLLAELKKQDFPKSIKFHDIDENGCPEAGKGYWRRYKIEELLLYATRNYEKDISTVISGISLPFEIIESRRFKHANHIYFLLLEMKMSDFKQRMRLRLKNAHAIGSLAEIYRYNSDLGKRLKNQIMNVKNGYIIKTNGKSEKEVLGEVLKLLDKISGR